jgi:hypothetical protein
MDGLVATFGELPGFTPSGFVAWVYPPSVLAEASRRSGATRSFRFEGGASALVHVYGRPQTVEHERVVQSLLVAGYERERDFADETWCRRWLSGSRHVVRELELLAAIGNDGLAEVLPARRPTPRPIGAPLNTVVAYTAAIEQARSARVKWNELSLSFWRSDRLVEECVAGVLKLDVSATAVDGVFAREVHVIAHAYAEASGVAIPSALARMIRQSLRSRGYALFARRRGGTKGPTLQVGGSKTLRSPAAAARECELVRMAIASAINVG